MLICYLPQVGPIQNERKGMLSFDEGRSFEWLSQSLCNIWSTLTGLKCF